MLGPDRSSAPSAGAISAHVTPPVAPHRPPFPLRVATRGSPLALTQTRAFLRMLSHFCPVLRDLEAFEEHVITTTGDTVQDRRLAEIGGKGLFSKEIHEALVQGRVDFAVHSLKDLETVLPPGVVLACTLRREDARDVLILGPDCAEPDPANPYACLPQGGLLGTSSVRRQAQILAERPDLKPVLLRGNVQTRLDKVARGECAASLLALAGLRRLGLDAKASVVLDADRMVPAAGQGIVAVTVRENDLALRELLAAIEDATARAVSTAERALLLELDGSCRTPIGGHARVIRDASGSRLTLTGLVAREDGSFLLRRTVEGAIDDGERLGRALGAELRAESPADIFIGD